MTQISEHAFYAAVKAECDKAGIGDIGRTFVELACLENADIPSRVWEMAHDTLRYYVDVGRLEAVSRNEVE